MSGLYSGLTKRPSNRKRLFFRGVGVRFPWPASDFLAFCLGPSMHGPSMRPAYPSPCPFHVTRDPFHVLFNQLSPLISPNTG